LPIQSDVITSTISTISAQLPGDTGRAPEMAFPVVCWQSRSPTGAPLAPSIGNPTPSLRRRHTARLWRILRITAYASLTFQSCRLSILRRRNRSPHNASRTARHRQRGNRITAGPGLTTATPSAWSHCGRWPGLVAGQQLGRRMASDANHSLLSDARYRARGFGMEGSDVSAARFDRRRTSGDKFTT
jgi:hypothetical protein